MLTSKFANKMVSHRTIKLSVENRTLLQFECVVTLPRGAEFLNAGFSGGGVFLSALVDESKEDMNYTIFVIKGSFPFMHTFDLSYIDTVYVRSKEEMPIGIFHIYLKKKG